MNQEKKHDWPAVIADCFSVGRIIYRLFAAWFFFALINLIKGGSPVDLSFAQGISLVRALLLLVLLFILQSVVAVVLHPYHTDSWILTLSALFCSQVWLMAAGGTDNAVYFALADILVLALILRAFYRENRVLFAYLRARPVSARLVPIGVGVCAAVMCTVIAVITVLRYQTFSAPGFDFGIFANMFHHMRTTGLPMVTCERDMLISHFDVHISPIFYLLLPLYLIFPSPATLQIGQALVLALAVIPLYFLARHYRLSGRCTLAVCALYCFFPVVSTACFYDIHENCFLPLCLFCLFLFFEQERPLPMYLSAACLLMVKEDAAVYLLIFACYIFIARKKRLHGVILSVAALLYFAFCIYYLNTYGQGVLVGRYDALIYDADAGMIGALKTLLVSPGYLISLLFSSADGGARKLLYVLTLFLPLALLPLRSHKHARLLLVAPLLLNLLTMYQYLYHTGFQYHFGVTAFLLYVTVLNLADFVPARRAKALCAALLSCACLYLALVVPNMIGYIERYQNGADLYAEMEQTLDSIPRDATVNASPFLIAHLSDCAEIYEVDYHDNKPDVDYVVLDMRYDVEKYRKEYLAHGYVRDDRSTDTILILARSASN